MKSLVAALFFVFCNPLFAQHNVIYVVPGDLQGLADAITQANAQSTEWVSTISLETGVFTATGDVQLPPITGRLEIRGYSRSRFSEITASPAWEADTLFVVEKGAELTLKLIEFRDINIGHEPPALIINRGELSFEAVSFSSVKSQSICIGRFDQNAGGPVILNEKDASMSFENVSFVNSGNEQTCPVSEGGIINNYGYASLKKVQTYLDESFESDMPFRNWGSMDIVNSSFRNFVPLTTAYKRELIMSFEGAYTTIANSIVEGFEGSSCDDVKSLGYNINDDAECGWSSEGDLIGIDPGIIWRPRFYTLDYPVAHALMPTPSSPAVGSGNCGFPCDRGAFSPDPSLLAKGGMNGLYYNPAADGHYILIQQTEYLTLVIWNTFNLEGEHVWVYGTGQIAENNTLRAETYINREVSIIPGDSDPQAEYWGIIDIEMQSCMDGYFAFDSEFPEFGYGEFPIKRLASIKQLGCTDADYR